MNNKRAHEGLFSAVSPSEEARCMLQISAPQLMRADTKPSYVSAKGDGRRGCLMVMNNGRLRSAPETHALASGRMGENSSLQSSVSSGGESSRVRLRARLGKTPAEVSRPHKPLWSVGSHVWDHTAEGGHPGVSRRGRFQMS